MGAFKFLTCKACGLAHLNELLDFGRHPISSRYGLLRHDLGATFKLSMAVCNHCGTVQLFDYIPEFELIEQPSWITYNEPETHLDGLVQELNWLAGGFSSPVRGISYKDDSMIRRFNDLGYKNSEIYDFALDGTSPKVLNIENLQKLVNPKHCSSVSKKQQRADILLVRHVLEHTFDTKNFLLGIKCLMTNTGFVVFEVPDCSQQFKCRDYTCLWEEHTIYFVEETFKRTLEENGFTIEKLLTYVYEVESSLVAICTLSDAQKNDGVPRRAQLSADYLNTISDFGNDFSRTKSAIRDVVLGQKKSGKVAIFGAGHISTTFIHLFELQKFISFVIDDDPNKCGKFVPGTSIEIRSSEVMLQGDIDTCLLSLSPESEKKFLKEKADLLINIKTVASIFSGKENSILRGNSFAK